MKFTCRVDLTQYLRFEVMNSNTALAPSTPLTPSLPPMPVIFKAKHLSSG